MTRRETARGVAEQLFRAEDAIDGAIREAARLTLAVTDARGDMRLAAVVGGDVFDHAAALHARLASPRAEAVSLHEALAEVRDRLRLDGGDDFGSYDKPPKQATFAPAEASPAPLRRLRGL